LVDGVGSALTEEGTWMLGDFTITIGDNDIMGNPINDMPTYTIDRDRPAAMDDLP
jgi:hypothetical protein